MRRVAWLIVAAVAIALVAYATFRPPPPPPEPSRQAAPVFSYEVVAEYPHDPAAFTQGLLYRDGHLYESTGPTGRSTLRKVRLESGELLAQRALDERVFGEGLAEWSGRLLQLTPIRTEVTIPSALKKLGDPDAALSEIGRKFGVNIGVAYDIDTLEPRSTFTFENEGWGLTADGKRLVLSDGTARLRFLDPDTLAPVGRVDVTDAGEKIVLLNELEYVDGEVYANVWQTDRIAVIDPATGHVRRWIDLTGLAARLDPQPARDAGAVLNGIAYDAARRRLFVTGKLWPRVFEIRVVSRP
jgi:glutaminyl-peptide cyclotransferase